MTTTTSVHLKSSPHNEVRRRIKTCVGQENTFKPPSSWETTASLPQMFPNKKAMNIFTDTRGHDRLPLVHLFTIVVRLNGEVTFCEAEDVSAEKGREEEELELRVVFVHELRLQRNPVIVVI